MASFVGHLLGAVIFFLIFTYILTAYNLIDVSTSSWLLCFMVFMTYSLLPDIDTPNSYVSKAVTSQLAVLAMVLFGYFYFTGDDRGAIVVLFTLLLLLIIILSRHRRFFHSPLAGLLLASPLFFWDGNMFVFGLLGYNTHLIIDTLT